MNHRYIYKGTPLQVHSGFGFAPTTIMFALTHVINASIFLSLLFTFRAIHSYPRRRGLPYPPGPSGWPIIGNLLNLPSKSTWLTYTEFSKKYGMGALSADVFFFFLRPGGRVHYVLPWSRKRHRCIEYRQSYQRSTGKTWRHLLRSSSFSIP